MKRALGLALLSLVAAPAVAVLAVACANGGNDDVSADASTGSSAGDDTGAPVFEAAAVEAAAVDVLTGTGPPAPGDAGAPETEGSDAPADARADAGDANPCDGGTIACDGSCVDPATDVDNCGGCGFSCSSGICGTALSADMTASPAAWDLNGSAVWDPTGPSARLTAAKTYSVAGSVVYEHPIVTDAFEASFLFRIGANGGGQYDGMGFMLQTTGPTAVGSNGGGLGMSGLMGYGVELDVYDNNQCGDNSANHVGIDNLDSCGSGLLTSLFASPDLTGTVTLSDAQWHTAVVALASGTMSVTVDGHAVAGILLQGFTPGTPYYYGFAGAIGGGSSSLGMQTEVKDVTITFPTPRCL